MLDIALVKHRQLALVGGWLQSQLHDRAEASVIWRLRTRICITRFVEIEFLELGPLGGTDRFPDA